MKQKQIKATPKVAKSTKKETPAKKPHWKVDENDEVAKQAKSTKKGTPAKKAPVEVEESDDEVEVEQKKIISKTPMGKKAAKIQKPVVEESSDEEQEEVVDQEDIEQDDEVEEGDEEASEEEGEDEDEEHEQEEDGSEEDDDDEAPSEEAIEKEEPTIPSQVKSEPIPETVPCNRVIYVTKLPKKCTKMNIIEAFAKYGAIEQVHILTTTGGTVANVAYKTERAALAASADDRKVKVLDSIVWVKIKKERNLNDRDRCVFVKYIKSGTSEEQLREHFKSCGEIEAVKLLTKYNEIRFAIVTFTDKSAIPEALKLHNSVLNGVNIGVTEKQTITGPSTNEGLTVLVKNKQNFENIDVSKLETIFSKCGEIAILDVVCKKNVLAFITFKNEMAVEKALKLSGKTEEDIELDIELYDRVKRWTSIHVSNLPRDCTEEDLTNVFSKAGEIVSIALKNGHAKINFTDCEGYCKSFLYNETFIRGKIIFIEPYSFRKSMVFKSKPPQKRGFKRPNQNGYSVFKPKKAKVF